MVESFSQGDQKESVLDTTYSCVRKRARASSEAGACGNEGNAIDELRRFDRGSIGSTALTPLILVLT